MQPRYITLPASPALREPKVSEEPRKCPARIPGGSWTQKAACAVLTQPARSFSASRPGKRRERTSAWRHGFALKRCGPTELYKIALSPTKPRGIHSQTRPILSIVSPELPLEQWQIAYGSMQDHARVSEPKGANLVHKNCYSWTVLVRRKEGVRWECFRARSPDARVR